MGLSYSLESNFMYSLYILDISPLSDVGLVKNFSLFSDLKEIIKIIKLITTVRKKAPWTNVVSIKIKQGTYFQTVVG